ncbi:MAG TPA: N-acetylmuramoyl-L-alanine amidase [Phycisphaerales bacterium]|nr:N-acetylmuramoyl-L-alanine amidase [Phycisphaerales bacterium]
MSVIHRDNQDMKRPLSRRDILGLALGAGAAWLAGCGSNQTRLSRVGDPIPGSPVYRPLPSRRRFPHTTRTHPSTRPPTDLSVIGRRTWASRGPIVSRADRMGMVRYITVHHDGMSPFTSTLYDDAARRIEAIRHAHVAKGWADIGYHYAIDPAGRIWAARPEALQGAHVKYHNPNNLGILMLGNFEKQQPTVAAKKTLDAFLTMKMDEFHVPVNKVFTHREWAPTACPGRHLQSHMQVARARGGAIRTASAARTT